MNWCEGQSRGDELSEDSPEAELPTALQRARSAPPAPAAPAAQQLRSAHGTVTAEPFGWMADRRDPRLLTYLTAEREYYLAAVRALDPLRSRLGAEFAERLPAEEVSAPWRCGPYSYLEYTPPGAECPQLLRRHHDSDDDYEVVLDGGKVPPSRASTATEESPRRAPRPADRGSYFRFGVCEPSPDGALIAYSVDFSGDEVYELRFRDTVGCTDLAERIGRSYYGCAWSADSRAFFYVRHDAAFRPYQVLRHVIGTDPVTDALVFSEPDARYHVTVSATRSGDWIVISTAARDTNEQWIILAARYDAPPRLIEPRRPGVEYFTEHLAGPAARQRAGPDSRSSPMMARPNTGWSRLPPGQRAAATGVNSCLATRRPGSAGWTWSAVTSSCPAGRAAILSCGSCGRTAATTTSIREPRPGSSRPLRRVPTTQRN